MDRRSSNGWGDLTTLLAVLSHGQEQTRQLEAHLLDAADPSSMHQLLLCKSLARQIESTFRTAISVVEATDISHQSSSRSPDRDRLLIDDDHERMEIMCNKRKSALRWTRQVRVCPPVGAAGIEEPLLADGYSWRKYGQKDILGAKYPRSYYRCTYRNSRGCLATKQVQRSDENPFLMDVTYRGAHTCTEKHETVVEALSLQKDTGHINSQNNDLLQQLHKQPLMSLRAPPLPLKKTDHDLNSRRGQILDPSPPTTLEAASYIDTNFSPSTFMLAPRGASSEMNYLPLSGRCGVSNYGAQEAAELAANTPISDMDFGFRQGGDFGTDFPFDGSSFY